MANDAHDNAQTDADVLARLTAGAPCDFCGEPAGCHLESCLTLTTVEGDMIREACDCVREALDHLGLDADRLQDEDVIMDYLAVQEAVAALGTEIFDYTHAWRTARGQEARWAQCLCRPAGRIQAACPVHGVKSFAAEVRHP